MFLDNLDYQVMIGERAFDLIQQSDEENRRRAEEMAQEEMAGYLRPRYDVRRIFARRGTERNMQIVMFLCDITLYHLVSWLPQKMGYEIREIRYHRAIEWLQGVQSGKNPCLRGGGVPYNFPNGDATLLANLALLLPFSCLDARKGAKENQGYGQGGLKVKAADAEIRRTCFALRLSFRHSDFRARPCGLGFPSARRPMPFCLTDDGAIYIRDGRPRLPRAYAR